MAVVTGPRWPYDLPWSIDEDPISTSDDRLTRRLYRAYGFNEEEAVPVFLWRKNIDCIAAGSITPAHPTRPQWGECHLPLDCTVYERITPALGRVGAMMAMSESFFAKILFADVKSYADPALYDHKYLDPQYQPTIEHRHILVRTIQRLSSSLRIFMGLDDSIIDCHGTSDGRIFAVGSAYFYHLRVCISPAYLRFFSNPLYHLVEEDTRNTMLFSLATTITHEMAHSFWEIRHAQAHVRRIKDQGGNGINSPIRAPPEPVIHETVPHSELGRAWELFFFGGFPELRGRIDDPKAENPWVWVNGVQLLGWKSLLDVDVGPTIIGGAIDEAVQAFLDDDILDLVIIALEDRKQKTGGELESLTFDEALNIAYVTVFDEKGELRSASLKENGPEKQQE